MQIEITAKNIELTPSLDAFIREKMGTLDKFVKKYEDLQEVELKTTIEIAADHKSGREFRAAADMLLPGANLHAEEINSDAHAAVDAVRHKLQQEISKYKDEH